MFTIVKKLSKAKIYTIMFASPSSVVIYLEHFELLMRMD